MLDRVGQFTGDAADATKRGAASAALRAEVAILEGRLAALTKEEAALATRQTTAHDVGATVARRRQLKEEIRATHAEIASKLAKVSALKRSKAEAAKIATMTARAAARRAACAGCLQFIAAVVLLLAAAGGAAYEFGLWEVPPSFFDRDRLFDGHVTRYERQTYLRALSAASLTAVAACVVALSTRRSGGALAAACCIVVLVAGGSDEAVDEARYGRLYEHKPTLAAAVVLLVLVIGLGCCAAPSSRRDAVGADVAPSAAALRHVGVAAIGLLLLLALTLAQTPLGASLTARLPEEVSAYVQDGQDDEAVLPYALLGTALLAAAWTIHVLCFPFCGAFPFCCLTKPAAAPDAATPAKTTAFSFLTPRKEAPEEPGVLDLLGCAVCGAGRKPSPASRGPSPARAKAMV